MDTASFAPNSLKYKDLAIDPFRRQCTFRGESISLTNTEFAILRFLMENKGRVVPAQELSDAVWQDEVSSGRNDCLAVHIRHIREKLHVHKPFAMVKTAWGKGYWVE